MQHHLQIFIRRTAIMLCLLFAVCLFVGCSSSASDHLAPSEPADLSPAQVLVPEASGTVTYEEPGLVLLDVSNRSEGYIMMKYEGNNENVKFQIFAPDGTNYTYQVTNYGDYTVYPLPCGSGDYSLRLLESTAQEGEYAVAFTQGISVSLKDDYTAFLYPNYYVNFNAESEAVKKGEELAGGCSSDLEVVSSVYHFVINNVTYDTEKAASVQSGYVPDIDEILATGTGICFDYASLMASMLRSQGIPTRLVFGYVGDAYHAWISCYVDEAGWVDDIIQFDGQDWSLMDPTLASNNSSRSVQQFIGDGSSYLTKYIY